MKLSLKEGPIACSIQVVDSFLGYQSSNNSQVDFTIYEETLDYIEPNHLISVIGWGVGPSGQQHWIGRNSWGRHWGDNGFFYMAMDKNTLGIEADCVAVDPEVIEKDF